MREGDSSSSVSPDSTNGIKAQGRWQIPELIFYSPEARGRRAVRGEPCLCSQPGAGSAGGRGHFQFGWAALAASSVSCVRSAWAWGVTGMFSPARALLLSHGWAGLMGTLPYRGVCISGGGGFGVQGRPQVPPAASPPAFRALLSSCPVGFYS